MGEQGPAADVADGIDMGVIGLLAAVDLDEPLVVDLDGGAFQPQVRAVRNPSHRDEDTVVEFLECLPVLVEDYLDLFAAGCHG